MQGKDIVPQTALPRNGGQPHRIISLITALLVAAVALGSFAISYNALYDMAIRNGIVGPLAYVWPLLVDMSMIVFSLSVVNAYLHAETTWRQWGLVIIYTIATIAFNVLHAPSNLQARVIAAIAPVSLFFSFEILMSQLRSGVKRSTLFYSIGQLEHELEQKRSNFDTRLEQMRLRLRQRFDRERSALTTEIEQLQNDRTNKRSIIEKLDEQIEQKRLTIDQLEQEIEQLERSKNAAQIVQYDVLNAVNAEKLDGKQQALNRLLNFYRTNPYATLAEAGREIDRSKGTVSNYLAELEQAGLIHRNGDGIEVTT